MTTPFAERLARLEAIEAIRALKMRYARWCDDGFPPAELSSIFTDDGTWDGGEVFGRHVGTAALATFFAGARRDVGWALHYIVSGAVEIGDDGRTGTSTWYLWQPMTLDGCAVWHMGRYADRHVLTDAGWRISALHLTVEALTHVDRGWVKERYLTRPLGRVLTMRLANLLGRAVLLAGDGAIDVATASEGRFGPDVQTLYDRWDALRAWADDLAVDQHPAVPYRDADLGPPAPAPRQLFAIGLNYHEHAEELDAAAPVGHPSVFTKFASSLAGPSGHVALPSGGTTDWEVELVVVIGRHCHAVDEGGAWSAVAGVTVGQDLSERTLQLANPMPQFSLAKSYPGFSPMGPAVVTVDELDDRDDVALHCSVNGEVVQSARTRQMIFPVPALIREISRVTPLYPGDVIYTGTPGGVGHSSAPPRYLAADDVLVTAIDGVGSMRHTFGPAEPTASAAGQPDQVAQGSGSGFPPRWVSKVGSATIETRAGGGSGQPH